MPTTADTRVAALAAAGLALLLAAAPLAAAPSNEDRLGACLISGSAGAPGDLLSAITAVRSLCHTQIKRVREDRLQAVEARFGLPEARLTRERQEELDRARDAAIRQLNDDIGRVIAAHTGLTQ